MIWCRRHTQRQEQLRRSKKSKMDKQRILELLPHLNSRPTSEQNRTGWVISSCPFALFKHSQGVDRHPSFGVRIVERQISDYHCFSCDSHGVLMDLAIELKHLFAGSAPEGYDLRSAVSMIHAEEDAAELGYVPDYGEREETNNKVKHFPEEWLDSFQPWYKFKTAREYLQKRNVMEDLADQLDLRFDSTRQRVCFPIRDWGGYLVGLHGRDITDKQMAYYVYKYKDHFNKLVWPGEQHLDVDKPVILCESVFDYASIYRVYRNVACSLSAGIGRDKCKRVSSILDLITFYDYGTGGDTARKSIDKYLGHTVPLHIVPNEDQGDPGNMSVNELIDRLDPIINLDEIIL